MKHPIKHVRHHARKHHQNHLNLRKLLHLPIIREKILEIFFGTFTFTLLTIVIFMNWGNIVSFLTPDPAPEPPEIVTTGFQQGALGVYRISDQRQEEHEEWIANLPTSGYQLGMEGNRILGIAREEAFEEIQTAFESSLFLTADLSRGQHLTSLQEDEGKYLQKSILSTYYLGQKTVTINDTLSLDTKLLSQLNSALSVDLFAFLNQANNRADQLQGYLNLLTILEEEANQRIIDLSSTVAFLEGNFLAQEQEIEFTEEQFFLDLEEFSGTDAQKNLDEFIELQAGQNEIKAKIGAYQQLLDYYEFFLPRLETMILAVRENWDALIAGVKVTEIEGMQLPLIIRP